MLPVVESIEDPEILDPVSSVNCPTDEDMPTEEDRSPVTTRVEPSKVKLDSALIPEESILVMILLFAALVYSFISPPGDDVRNRLLPDPRTRKLSPGIPEPDRSP
jgi:hypothetical protein